MTSSFIKENVEFHFPQLFFTSTNMKRYKYLIMSQLGKGWKTSIGSEFRS